MDIQKSIILTCIFIYNIQFVGILIRCDKTIAVARANVMAAKALKMQLINEMLTPGEI